MKEVIITDIKYRMTLAAIWSLGDHGVPIHAVAYESTPENARLGFFSKFISYRHVISFDELIPSLEKIAKDIVNRTGEKPVLIVPMTKTEEMVIAHSERLRQSMDFLLPSANQLLQANSTYHLLQVARKIGVDVPVTTWQSENQTIEEVTEMLSFPAVIKYRHAERLSLKPKARYQVVRNDAQCILCYAEMSKLQESPLIQEYVEGDGYGVSAVCDTMGNAVSIFCHKRLREYPVSGGPSTYCKSVWVQPMVDQAVALLKALNWSGFAMVEFKGTPENFRLMEINPRFWGSMALSYYAGSDMVMAYYGLFSKDEKAHDPSQKSVHKWHDQYRLDTKMRFFLQDVLSVPGYIKKSKHPIRFLGRFLCDLFDRSVYGGIRRKGDTKPARMYMRNVFRRRR